MLGTLRSTLTVLAPRRADQRRRWTVSDTNGCIARVNFPAPALLALIDSESEKFGHILTVAGERMDQLFESVHYLRPIAGLPRGSFSVVGRTPNPQADGSLPDDLFATRQR